MGAYEDLVAGTVEAIMVPGQPMRIFDIVSTAMEQLGPDFAGQVSSRVRMGAVSTILRNDPRFEEVARGVWVLRGDGPEAGVPSTPRRPPLAGSTAAAAAAPEPICDVDAVGAAGARLSPSSCRQAFGG